MKGWQGERVRGSGAETLVIGSNFSPPDPFEGLLDNIRMWLRVRTAPEICAASAVTPCL